MGSSQRPEMAKDPTYHLGPGIYDCNTKQRVPGGKISKEHKEKPTNPMLGPGTYDIASDSFNDTKKKFTMRGKPEVKDKTKDLPGPGAYELASFHPSKHGATLGDGKRSEFVKTSKSIPGPGTYDLPTETRHINKGPKYS